MSSSSAGNIQVVDLGANDANDATPGYAIYEGGSLARAAFINFMTDPSGANDLQVSLQIEEGAPGNVQVKWVTVGSKGSRMMTE